MEACLIATPERFSLFPIQHPDLWAFYEEQEAAFWTASELDLSQDKIDFRTKLSKDEQHFVSMILAFFHSSDICVIENLVTDFAQRIQYPETRCYIMAQGFIEAVHTQSYALMLDVILDTKEEKERVFRAVQNSESIKAKNEWAVRYIENGSFQQRIVAFVIVEYLFFSGSFAAIFYLRSRSLLPGICFGNSKIIVDEGVHSRHWVHFYNNHIQHKLKAEEVEGMMRDAVALETAFIVESLPCRIIGMNSDSMTEYIQFVSNRIMSDLHLTPLFPGAKCPFSFMETIALEGKTNFFEGRVAEYAISKGFSGEEGKFDTEAEF